MPERDRIDRLGEWLQEQTEQLAERATGSVEQAAQVNADPHATGAEPIDAQNDLANAQLLRETSEQAREHLQEAAEEGAIARPRASFLTQALEWVGGAAIVAGLIAVPYALGWRPSRDEPVEEPATPPIVFDLGGLPDQGVYDAIESARDAEESFSELVALSAAHEAEMRDRIRAFKQGRFFAVELPSSLSGLDATLFAARAEVPLPGETAQAQLAPVVEAPLAQVMALMPLDLRDEAIERIEQAWQEEVERRNPGYSDDPGGGSSGGNLDLPKGIDFGPGFGSFKFR